MQVKALPEARSDRVERPSAVRGAPIPAPIEEATLRCLAKAPGDRFPSAADLAAALSGA